MYAYFCKNFYLMKKFLSFLVLMFCLTGTFNSFAQITSFTGKIVDEHNEPVPGSHIRIFKGGRIVELTADDEGLFTIAQIPAGDYTADINANGRVVRNKKLYIQPEGRVKIYYNFKLYAHGVTVSIMAKSRQMANNQ
jgi:hypothetical protein